MRFMLTERIVILGDRYIYLIQPWFRFCKLVSSQLLFNDWVSTTCWNRLWHGILYDGYVWQNWRLMKNWYKFRWNSNRKLLQLSAVLLNLQHEIYLVSYLIYTRVLFRGKTTGTRSSPLIPI
jgi:hypothetical protein